MISVYVKELYLRNFFSVGHGGFRMQMDKSHMSLVVGKNASGKSTIFDGLLWTLYGSAQRPNIRNENIPNRASQSSTVICEVKIILQGKEYVVRRGLSPTIFEVYVDDKNIYDGWKKPDAEKNFVEQVLRMSKKSFIEVSHVNTDTVPFARIAPIDRRRFVEQILDIGEISVMQDLLKKELKLKNNEIDKIERQQLIAQTRLEDAIENNATIAGNTEEKREKYKVLLASKQEQLEQAKTHLLDMQERQKAAKKIFDDNPEIDKETLNALNKEVGEYEATIKKSEKDISFFETNEKCPVCSQNITSDFRKAQCNHGKESITAAYTEIGALNEKIEKLSEKDSLRKKAREAYNDVLIKVRLAENNVNSLQSQFIDMQADNTDNLQEADLEPLKKILNDIKAALDKLTINKEAVATAVELLSEENARAAVLQYYLPTINEKLNRHLVDLGFPGQVEVMPDFELRIFLGQHQTIYDTCSHGEKWRIDKAFLFMWRNLARLKHSVSTNLLWLDEAISSSIDSSGVYDFMAFLRHTMKEDNIFIVTHSQEVITKFEFDRTIHVDKVAGISRFDEE